MVTSQLIAKELKKRGNKTVKMVFLNPEPALNLSIIVREGDSYNYPEEGKLTNKDTTKSVCDYIQSKSPKPVKANLVASEVSKWKGSRGDAAVKKAKPKKKSILRKVIKKIKRKK